MSEISPKVGLLSDDRLAKQPPGNSNTSRNPDGPGEGREAVSVAGNDNTEITKKADILSYGSVTFEAVPSGTPVGTPLFVVWLTLVAACGSFLFGYDTGVVSGAMLYLREEFALTTVQQEAVVSVTIAAAAVSSLLGAWLNHNIGRRPTIFVSSVVFTGGATLLGFAVNLAMLIIGRLVVGVGIGLASMTVPVYIAECAPPSTRGSLVTVHQFMISFGMLASNVLAGAFSYVDEGWRYMLGLAAVPSLLQLFALICLPESPRWLVKAGRMEDAERALLRMRGRGDVTAELVAIKETCRKEIGKTNLFQVVCRMFSDRVVRRALVIGCGLQMFQQLAGINTVMYYTAAIMKMSGVRDNSLAIWLSCAVAGTNVVMTCVSMYLIDRLGRKPLVVVSFLGVLVSLVTLAVGFQLAAGHSPSVTLVTPGTKCSGFSDCDACVSDGGCGYCFLSTNGSVSEASCLISAGEYSDHSATGDCSQTAETGAVWGYDFCPTDYAWVTLMGMIMYIVAFAQGLAPVPWTMNAEIYPLWARSAGNALATATNWTFNLVVAMTFLTLTSELTKYGTYWLYSAVAVLGVLFVTLLVPETKGRSLEQMEQLLSRSWLVWPPT